MPSSLKFPDTNIRRIRQGSAAKRVHMKKLLLLLTALVAATAIHAQKSDTGKISVQETRCRVPFSFQPAKTSRLPADEGGRDGGFSEMVHSQFTGNMPGPFFSGPAHEVHFHGNGAKKPAISIRLYPVSEIPGVCTAGIKRNFRETEKGSNTLYFFDNSCDALSPGDVSRQTLMQNGKDQKGIFL